MSNRVAIIGVGITPFGKFLERSVRSLAEEAVGAALKDARLGPERIERVYFGNAASGIITGQEMVRAQAALRFTGLAGKPMINVENACASGSTAFHLAWQSVESGQADVVLAIGSEKLTHVDKAVSFGAFTKAVDLEEELPASIGTGSGSIFMDIYAEKTRKYMAATGATPEDFARITVKSRHAGARNPYAQFRKETTIEEVLSSRMISNPLTLSMCSSIGDGAAAVVLCSSSAVSKFNGANPVWARGCVLVSGYADSTKPNAVSRAAQGLYEVTGMGPKDVHVAEVHDATAPAEILHYENLQFCGLGDGSKLLRSGDTELGGRISVNPSGGLLSRGHPIGATGVAQIVELATQLRGRAGERQQLGAKVALAQNSGGQIGGDSAAAVCTMLLSS